MQTGDHLDHLLARGNQTGGANKAILDAVNEYCQTSQAHWLDTHEARHAA